MNISFNLLWQCLRNTTAEFYSKFIFNFVRNCHIVFQSGCTVLHFHLQWMKVPVAAYPYQKLILSINIFCSSAILIDAWWHCIIVLIFNPLIINEGFPYDSVVKESVCDAGNCLKCRIPKFNPWVRKIPWRKTWQPTPGFLPGKIPWTEESVRIQSMGFQESDKT